MIVCPFRFRHQELAADTSGQSRHSALDTPRSLLFAKLMANIYDNRFLHDVLRSFNAAYHRACSWSRGMTHRERGVLAALRRQKIRVARAADSASATSMALAIDGPNVRGGPGSYVPRSRRYTVQPPFSWR